MASPSRVCLRRPSRPVVVPTRVRERLRARWRHVRRDRGETPHFKSAAGDDAATRVRRIHSYEARMSATKARDRGRAGREFE
jgi:hypothetical protein